MDHSALQSNHGRARALDALRTLARCSARSHHPIARATRANALEAHRALHDRIITAAYAHAWVFVLVRFLLVGGTRVRKVPALTHIRGDRRGGKFTLFIAPNGRLAAVDCDAPHTWSPLSYEQACTRFGRNVTTAWLAFSLHGFGPRTPQAEVEACFKRARTFVRRLADTNPREADAASVGA